ncbi:MAG: sulfatase-like hydrolase/transferase [Myxococcota bacterium]
MSHSPLLLLLAAAACHHDGTTTDTSGKDTTGSDTGVTDTDTDTDTDTPTDTGPGTTETTHPDPYTWGALAFDGPPPSNLLIVSLDTTRRDFIGRYAGNDNTPNLDAVLEQAVVLDNHHSCSNWTAPSMTCIMSGRTSFENGFWTGFRNDPNLTQMPPADYDTIPAYLSELGMANTLVTASEVYAPQYGIPGGFDRIVERTWEPAEIVTTVGLQELETLRAGGAPWMFQIHYIDPHNSYCAPDVWLDPENYVDFPYDLCPGGDDEHQVVYDLEDQYPTWPADQQQAFLNNIRERYRAEVAYWDSEFGRFWTEAGASGALDDTLVLFVTDHGEQLFDRGYIGHGKLFGTEENMSVAAFWATNLAPAVVDKVTVHQDLTETIYKIFGVTPARPTQGIVVGAGGPDRVVDGMNYWTGDRVTMFAANQDHHMTYDFWGNRKLYDLTTDPAATTDLYAPSDPDVVALWDELLPFVNEISSTWTFLDPPVNPGP